MMNVETVREYCLSKPAVSEEFPFDDVSLVMKVGGKMFCLIPLDEPEPKIAVKCDPELAVELREKYSFVVPAYHFNKKHWNNICLDGSASDSFLRQWIDHSYSLVVNGLTKKVRAELGL